MLDTQAVQVRPLQLNISHDNWSDLASRGRFFYFTTRFPTAGLSVTHVRAEWFLDWSIAARPVITYLAAAYATYQRSKIRKRLGVDQVVMILATPSMKQNMV